MTLIHKLSARSMSNMAISVHVSLMSGQTTMIRAPCPFVGATSGLLSSATSQTILGLGKDIAKLPLPSEAFLGKGALGAEHTCKASHGPV